MGKRELLVNARKCFLRDEYKMLIADCLQSVSSMLTHLALPLTYYNCNWRLKIKLVLLGNCNGNKNIIININIKLINKPMNICSTVRLTHKIKTDIKLNLKAFTITITKGK